MIKLFRLLLQQVQDLTKRLTEMESTIKSLQTALTVPGTTLTSNSNSPSDSIPTIIVHPSSLSSSSSSSSSYASTSSDSSSNTPTPPLQSSTESSLSHSVPEATSESDIRSGYLDGNSKIVKMN